MKRVALIGSPEKKHVGETLERTRLWLKTRAEVVFCEITEDSRSALAKDPEMLFVVGGDGTLIAAIHGLQRDQLPIVGVNLGKVGYLAEFSIELLEREGDFLFQEQLVLTPRVMLDVLIEHAGGESSRSLGVNDCVVLAGAPHRMINIEVDTDDELVVRIRGDGLIVSTASGSTAHNLSAGGPILDPIATSFVLTPICPYALTLRPMVVNASRRISIRVTQANEGTAVLIDGRVRRRFAIGDQVTITRYAADLLLVRNPRRSMWYALRRKLMWGKTPKNSY